MQTSYASKMPGAFAGMLVDNRARRTETGVLEGASAIPFGLALIKGTAAGQLKLPSALTDKLVGVGQHSHGYYNQDLSSTAGIPVKGQINSLREGEIWVLVEETVADGDQAYFRTATEGGNTQLGSWRKSPGGVAQVSTLTPTAANSTGYAVNVFAGGRLFTFAIVSDALATATEICDAFRTAMAADAAFTALVVASGTATLILTGTGAGVPFDVYSSGPGVIAVAATTPPAPTAVAAPGCLFRSAAAGGALAKLEVNLPA